MLLRGAPHAALRSAAPDAACDACTALRRCAARPAPALPRCRRLAVLTHAAGAGGTKKRRSGGGSGRGSGRGDAAAGSRAQPRKPAVVGGVWAYEQLMLLWDDAFVACMREGERSAELLRVAADGFAAHGRGCVLVRVRVETGGGKGFGAGAPACCTAGHASGCLALTRPNCRVSRSGRPRAPGGLQRQRRLAALAHRRGGSFLPAARRHAGALPAVAVR
jgi:hypothetical protein